MEREILHVNTDDFYASVLRLRDATLRGRAVVVVGASPRGMVFSASYEARGDGVTRGMTTSAAMRLASHAAFLAPDWGLFRRASTAIFGVLRRYSPVIESVSLDEAYVDYTGCSRLFGPALDTGRRIKDEIARETGLAVSLGVASNKLVSHVASRTAKCANLVDVYAGYERSFVAPVPVERFPLIGEKRAPVLHDLGVVRVGDVLLFTEEIFAFCFGSWGKRLYRGALGEDTTPVRTRAGVDERLTVEEVLEPDRIERRFLEGALYRLAERLGEKLRAERSLAGAVGLEVRYADGMTAKGMGRPEARAAEDGGGRLEKSGVAPAPEAAGAPVSDDLSIYESAREIFTRLYARRVRVRSLVLSAGRITPAPLQLELFTGEREAAAERKGRLYAALDRLRAAYPGRAAPAFGRTCAGPVGAGPRSVGPAAASPRSAGPVGDCTPRVLADAAPRAGTPSPPPALYR